MTRSLQIRLVILLAANLLLLAGIRLLLGRGVAFSRVVLDAASSLAPTLLAALGLTGAFFAGAIDLSIGSIVAVSGTVFGILVTKSFPPTVCFAACVLVAVALSVFNAAASRALRMPTILWTLASRTIYRGLALILADSSVARFGGSFAIPDEAFHLPGKAYAHWILLLALLGAILWEHHGKAPRLWLALGSSEEACRLQGLRPGRILLGAFFAAGTFLGLAALVQVTQVQTIEPARLALGFELPVIGAVVLGGTNVFGGEGSYWGTILGAVFLHLLGQLLVFAGVSIYWREAVSGGAIVLVIGLDCLLHKRRKREEELE